jgi:putative ABC transport system substrate-binding protein
MEDTRKKVFIGEKTMKKIAAIIAAVCLCGALAVSCKAAPKTYKIGVVQLVEHVALDASYKGFVDGLKDAGYEDGKNIKIDFQNAQGEQANCQTIAQKLVNDKDDLILAIATPAAQAVANQTQTIPVLVTAVTDPATAKLVVSNEAPGTNVTGTSDLTPVAQQMDLIKQIVPNVKTVGLLYCSSEQNSKFQIDIAKANLDKLGIKYIDATVSNSNEIQQVVQSLVGKVEAVYAPTDNMIAAGVPTVAGVLNPAKIPFVCGEEGMVKAGGLITYGINYYELGKQTAKMAVEIMKDGKKPADMPIQYLETCDVAINEETAKAIGITLPEDLVAKAKK